MELNYEYKQKDETIPEEENPLPVPSFDLDDSADPVVPDTEAQSQRVEQTFEEEAPVLSTDNKSNNVWQYNIEFNPDDIQENHSREANVDFIPYHNKSPHGRTCPACGSSSLFRSHSKNLTERVRKKLTSQRLYRCHSCEWRGWLS
ncbi:MAG: transposase [Chlorobi bacterium]|nr:transposase [Chlorobiota bacterium]